MKLLKEKQAAEMLQLKEATLRNWRLRGKGPQYSKLGGAIRYREEDIIGWINASIVTSHDPTDDLAV